MPYYIGVDGGGTKTAYALFNEKKEVLHAHEGSGSNHENFDGGFDEAAARLHAGVMDLLAKAGLALGDVTAIFMGLAGIDHPYQHDAMMERLQGLGKLKIVNDGYIAVKAGCASGAGIGLNLGTGTCCNSIDRQGNLRMLAGLGEFSGDVGNGAWLGIQTFKIAYDDLVLGIEKSAITDMITQQFGDDIMPLIQELDSEGGNDTKKSFVRIFFAAVNAGDHVATREAEQMALRGAQMIAAHLRDGDFATPCEVVLCGSIHTKLPSDVYVDMLAQRARELSGRELLFSKLTRAPVMGCIDWMVQEFA